MVRGWEDGAPRAPVSLPSKAPPLWVCRTGPSSGIQTCSREGLALLTHSELALCPLGSVPGVGLGACFHLCQGHRHHGPVGPLWRQALPFSDCFALGWGGEHRTGNPTPQAASGCGWNLCCCVWALGTAHGPTLSPLP